MTVSVLDRTSTIDQPTLGNLHDEAGKVDEAILPCRVNDPELWFAESPSDVEFAKALCVDCPVRGRRHRASRAVGRVGWTALHPGSRRPPQASAWPSPQGRGGRVAATRRPSTPTVASRPRRNQPTR